MSDAQQIQTDADDGAVQAELSVIRPNIPVTPPANGAAADKRKRVDLRAEGKRRLVDMGFHKQVTGSQQATNLLYEAYGLAAWLGPQHYHLVKRWAQLGALIPALVERLYEGGLFKQDGDPLKANETLLRYMAELRAHEKEAGLTPSSHLALGLGAARGRALDLASAMSDGAADVAELEGRIMERLQRGGGGATTPAAAISSEEGRDGG